MNVVTRAAAGNPELSAQLKALPAGGGFTAQGFYIIGADGSFYGWDNTHYMPNVIKFLDDGLSQFRLHPPALVEISEKQIAEPFSITPDASTSIVRVFTRVSPVPAGCDGLNKSVGRDHLWIFADEAKQILAASENGHSFSLPNNLTGRLVRFHLIDNVRGEPDEWQAEDIKEALFSAELIGHDANVKHFRFKGTYAQETANHQRGQKGSLEGTFDIAQATSRVINFRAYGEAQAWGRSTFTPGEPKGKFGLATAMVSTDDATSKIVPPQHYWGDGSGYRNAAIVFQR